MKIALIGYGKMGKEIEKIALSRGHEIVSIIDVNNQEDFNKSYGSLLQLYKNLRSRSEVGFRQYRMDGQTR